MCSPPTAAAPQAHARTLASYLGESGSETSQVTIAGESIQSLRLRVGLFDCAGFMEQHGQLVLVAGQQLTVNTATGGASGMAVAGVEPVGPTLMADCWCPNNLEHQTVSDQAVIQAAGERTPDLNKWTYFKCIRDTADGHCAGTVIKVNGSYSLPTPLKSLGF